MMIAKALLAARAAPRGIAVINAGISGARLMYVPSEQVGAASTCLPVEDEALLAAPALLREGAGALKLENDRPLAVRAVCQTGL